MTTGHRTSTTGGILKADTVLRYTDVLLGPGIGTFADARRLLTEPERPAAVAAAPAGVPGEGADGIRRNYLWMLVGAQDLIKPDRMILRWPAHHGVRAHPATATSVITRLVDVLDQRCGDRADPRRYTAWEIDHAPRQPGWRLPARTIGRRT